MDFYKIKYFKAALIAHLIIKVFYRIKLAKVKCELI